MHVEEQYLIHGYLDFQLDWNFLPPTAVSDCVTCACDASGNWVTVSNSVGWDPVLSTLGSIDWSSLLWVSDNVEQDSQVKYEAFQS